MIIRDENYFTDKYELTRTHSEVLEAVKVVKPGKTLDLGCGNGRNSLYLAANGYDVDAWDKNAMSIANVERIKSIENLDNLHTRVVDLNNLTFDRQYDFILSTVVLMFLEAKTIPGLIANMQRCTKPGGYNLIVAAMDIFTPRCRQLLEEYEQQGGFNETQAQEFVQEALETFRWHQSATVDEETYRALHNEHRLIADVVCFPGCHINHLTPRTLDIDRVQSMMPECGIEPKILIEGPPRREVPILLRQTSFKALEETVLFAGQKQGTHTARFGEIEQRGVALTPKGRQLYDDLLRNAGTGQDNLTHQMHLQETFRTFPDSEFLMRQQGLAWFRYRLTPSGEAHRQAIHPGDDPQPLIERGWVVAQPITYEDFLPVSAAGIFQSNLGNETQTRSHGNASREAFEQALGCPVLDEFQLYQEAEERSKRRCGLL